MSAKRLKFFQVFLKDDFYEEKEELLKLCTLGQEMPLGYDHPDIMLALAGIKLRPSVLKHIRAGYIYLTGYYFLLDAVVDDHFVNKIRPIYLTPLLSGALINFNRVIETLPEPRQRDFWNRYKKLVLENLNSVKLEKELSEGFSVSSKEREFISHAVRSNSTIILYELICAAASVKPDFRLQNLLEHVAYFLQLNDDLGDWREDFQEQRYSLILREAFKQLGKIPDESELTDFIYGSGFFENRAGDIIKGLENASQEFKDLFGKKSRNITKYLDSQIENIKNVLRAIISRKLKNFVYE